MSFAHPLRFYLVVSLFFFFIFTLVGKKSIEEDGDEGIIQVNHTVDDVIGLEAEDLATLEATLGAKKLQEIEKQLNGPKLKDLRKALKKNITSTEKEALQIALDSTTAQKLLRFDVMNNEKEVNSTIISPVRVETDSSYKKSSHNATEDIDKITSNENKDFFNVFNEIDWKLIDELRDKRQITDHQVYDSLHMGNITELQEHIIRQIIRVNRADQQQFVEYILKNLPLMMLILIPFFALILKLLYARRDQLYIKHLIHALHLHTFAYFFYGISLLVMVYAISDEDNAAIFGMLSFIVVSTYAYLSFLKVYKQHWFKTLIKFNVTGMIYLSCIFIFFITEIVVSFLLY